MILFHFYNSLHDDAISVSRLEVLILTPGLIAGQSSYTQKTVPICVLAEYRTVVLAVL